MTAALTGSYIESKIKALVDSAGGYAYVGGAAYSTPGALGLANLASSVQVANSQKQEPYSLFSLQLRHASVGTALLTPPPSWTYCPAPPYVSSSLSDSTVVAVYFSYAGLTAGTSADFVLSVDKPGASGGPYIAQENSVLLAPLVVHSMPIISSSLSGATVIRFIVTVAGITGGSWSDYVIDPMVTLICRSKHVA